MSLVQVLTDISHPQIRVVSQLPGPNWITAPGAQVPPNAAAIKLFCKHLFQDLGTSVVMVERDFHPGTLQRLKVGHIMNFSNHVWRLIRWGSLLSDLLLTDLRYNRISYSSMTINNFSLLVAIDCPDSLSPFRTSQEQLMFSIQCSISWVQTAVGIQFTDHPQNYSYKLHIVAASNDQTFFYYIYIISDFNRPFSNAIAQLSLFNGPVALTDRVL